MSYMYVSECVCVCVREKTNLESNIFSLQHSISDGLYSTMLSKLCDHHMIIT